jgi:ankyrin repeat protein
MVAYEISKGDKKKCLSLIKQKQITNTTRIRTNGDTILHIAAENGHAKAVDLLIQHNADVHTTVYELNEVDDF